MYLLLNQKGDYLEDKKLSSFWETERPSPTPPGAATISSRGSMIGRRQGF